jgi:hypothetical protein
MRSQLSGYDERWRGARNSYRTFVGKPLGKWLIERPRRRWEDTIKVDLNNIDCENWKCVKVVQDCAQRWASVLAVLNLFSITGGLVGLFMQVCHIYFSITTEFADTCHSCFVAGTGVYR